MRAFCRTPPSQKTASSRYQEPTRQVLAMTASRFIAIDSKQLMWRDILRMHKQQMLRNLLTAAMRVERRPPFIRGGPAPKMGTPDSNS
ncbi:MAG: hypothetical protein FD172_3167 [Methylocystaceae bacterium]|nr:MAG: hypothetical protein FD172_3167 [Methylocystaceae bacterium]